MKKILLIYDDVVTIDKEYFCKFKNLIILKLSEFKTFAKSETWVEVSDVLDATSKKSLYNFFKKDSEEFLYYKGSPFYVLNNKKVIALDDLRAYINCKNAENFDIETINKFALQMERIEAILELTCGSYANILEKELEEFQGVININAIVNKDEGDYLFVRDKTKGIMPEGKKIIDVNGLLLLKELKQIFEHII